MRWTSAFVLSFVKSTTVQSECAVHQSSGLEFRELSGLNRDSAVMQSKDELPACATAPSEVSDSTSMRALFLSLELADPLFSGNGVYARTLVRALLHTSPHATLLALCGQPPRSAEDPDFVDAKHSHHDSARNKSSQVSTVEATSVLPGVAAEVAARLQVRAVSLDRWGVLDRSSDWKGFAAAAEKVKKQMLFAPVSNRQWHCL